MASKNKKKNKKKLSQKEQVEKTIDLLDFKVPELKENTGLLSIATIAANPNHYKTVTIIADTVSWFDGESEHMRTMETGRAMAQAGHAISDLKLSYILEFKYPNKEELEEAVRDMCNVSITSIILKARDRKELDHVYDLCVENDLHVIEFWDEDKVYGNNKVLTAISIGPVYSSKLRGITDYLPLWEEL